MEKSLHLTPASFEIVTKHLNIIIVIPDLATRFSIRHLCPELLYITYNRLDLNIKC